MIPWCDDSIYEAPERFHIEAFHLRIQIYDYNNQSSVIKPSDNSYFSAHVHTLLLFRHIHSFCLSDLVCGFLFQLVSHQELDRRTARTACADISPTQTRSWHRQRCRSPNEITFGERVNDRRNMKAREALSCEDLSDILIYCDEWDATSKPAGLCLVRMGRCFTSLQDGWA